MQPVTLDPATGPYALATGEAAAYRLRILHSLYGQGTRRVLLESGLRRGMCVADVGCGIGMVTALLAEFVGPGGHVVGIDSSGAQLAQARERLNARGMNTSFVEASATDTGLPRGSFDLVYCRFLLLHLPEPERALREMRTLLKPDGILVCEDGDLTSAGSEPPSALGAFADLFGRLGPARGLDYALGRRLFHMVLAAGFPEPEITFNQPVMARGESKAPAGAVRRRGWVGICRRGIDLGRGAGSHPRRDAAPERGRGRPCGDAAHGSGVGEKAHSSYSGGCLSRSLTGLGGTAAIRVVQQVERSAPARERRHFSARALVAPRPRRRAPIFSAHATGADHGSASVSTGSAPRSATASRSRRVPSTRREKDKPEIPP